MKKLDLTLIQNYKVISFSKLFENFKELKEIIEQYLLGSEITYGSNPVTLIELSEIIFILDLANRLIYFDNSMRLDFLDFIDEIYKIDGIIYVNLEN
jgi:hypothetical protein